MKKRNVGRGQVVSVSVLFEGFDYMDGAYSAILAAEDGKIYTGLCTHNGRDHAVLGMYDPLTGKAEAVADMGEATGETNSGKHPQGKIHTKLRQAPDGKLYFATHLSHPLGDVNAQYDYLGGHFMRYDPVDRSCRSIARGPKEEGIITADLDANRMVMFGLTYPTGFFLVCDLARGVVRNFGPLTEGNPCRTIGVDDKGNAYFSRESGEIIKYNAQSEQIIKLGVRVPHLNMSAQGGRLEGGGWRTVIWDNSARMFYGIHAKSSLLFSLDPYRESVESIGVACAKRDVGNELATFASLAIAQARDRTIYYVSPCGFFDYFASKPLHGAAHLISFNPGTKRIADHGEIVTNDNRRLYGTQNAAISRDGRTLYMFGAVEAFPGDKTIPFTVIPVKNDGEVQYIPYQLRLVIVDLEQLRISR